MFPPSQIVSFNLQALSGVSGSISIACWIVVFSPQIFQNFQRGSADGLSLAFLVVWLLGDFFNIIGAVMQGVLPTMIILAAYYTIADMILLLQCLYYRRHSHSLVSPDGSHLSPATPLLEPAKDTEPELPQTPMWKAALFNTIVIISVCLAGVLGWHLSPSPSSPSSEDDKIEFSPLGQVFGYLCAILYLASRVPQILLNYKRRSCEGVSILFFLFAGIGNVTYVMSIFANTYDGDKEYWKYIAVNASWLLGSLGTLALDAVIFAQFFAYQDNADDGVDSEEGSEDERESLMTGI